MGVYRRGFRVEIGWKGQDEKGGYMYKGVVEEKGKGVWELVWRRSRKSDTPLL